MYRRNEVAAATERRLRRCKRGAPACGGLLASTQGPRSHTRRLFASVQSASRGSSEPKNAAKGTSSLPASWLVGE